MPARVPSPEVVQEICRLALRCTEWHPGATMLRWASRRPAYQRLLKRALDKLEEAYRAVPEAAAWRGWSPRERAILARIGRLRELLSAPLSRGDRDALEADIHWLGARCDVGSGPGEEWITPTEAKRIAADAGVKVGLTTIRRARDDEKLKCRPESEGSYDIELSSLKAWLFDRLQSARKKAARKKGRGS